MSGPLVTSVVTLLEGGANLILHGIQVASTIIEMPGQELVMIDTGMFGSTDLVQEMGEWGYDPGAVTLVINTHLHPDHAGGNRLFKQARILLSRREMEYESRFLDRIQEDAGLLFHGKAMPPPLSAAWRQMATELEFPAILGDPAQIEYLEEKPPLPPGFSIISAPGHTIASCAVRLQGPAQNLLISGDAYYHRDLGTRIAFPGLNYNDRLFLLTAQRLSRFTGIIAPGHDHPFWSPARQYLAEPQFTL